MVLGFLGGIGISAGMAGHVRSRDESQTLLQSVTSKAQCARALCDCGAHFVPSLPKSPSGGPARSSARA